jgi:hypothetical protein
MGQASVKGELLMPQPGTHARINRTDPIDGPKVVIDYRDLNGSYYQLENWGNYGKKIVEYYYKCNCPTKEEWRGHMGPFLGINNCPTKTFTHKIAFRSSYQFEVDDWIKRSSRKDGIMPEKKCSRCNEWSNIDQLDADGNHPDPNTCIWVLGAKVQELQRQAGKIERILGQMSNLLKELTGVEVC